MFFLQYFQGFFSEKNIEIKSDKVYFLNFTFGSLHNTSGMKKTNVSLT